MENKERNRKIVSFTIDKITSEQFNEIAKKKHINKSKLVENLIQKYIKENEK